MNFVASNNNDQSSQVIYTEQRSQLSMASQSISKFKGKDLSGGGDTSRLSILSGLNHGV